MKADKIIKALEDEIGRGRYNERSYIDCVNIEVFQNAISLINRQKAKIESLKQKNKELNILLNIQERNVREQRGIIDNLKILNKSTKYEAIKEFARRLKIRYESVDGQYIDRVLNKDIDNLVKEISEE